MDSNSRELMSEQIADDILEELERRIPEIRALDSLSKKLVREVLRYRAVKCIEKFDANSEGEEKTGDEETLETL